MYRGASSSNRFLMERLEYLLLRLLLGLLARLPWWVIHCLCRLSAFLLEHALHYRRRVIRENLANSFPEKSEAAADRVGLLPTVCLQLPLHPQAPSPPIP